MSNITMTTTSEQKAAEDLSDELLEIESQTVDEAYVRAEVTKVEAKSEDKIRVEAQLPNGETPTWSLDKPVPWNHSFLFARLAESKGYEPGSIHYLVGDDILVKPKDDGGWTIVNPWDTKKRLKMWASAHPGKTAAAVTVVAGVIALFVAIPKLVMIVGIVLVMLTLMVLSPP